MTDDPLRIDAVLEDPRHEGWRIDRYLSEALELFSRSQGKQRILEVRVNGLPAKLSRRLHRGDRLSVSYRPPPRLELLPEEIPLPVIYEDAAVIVLDKPQGLVVHPAAGHHGGTVVNALLWRFSELGRSFGGGDPRPGIVHRLDKDTSGVMIVAKDPESHEFLARQFKERSVRKLYLALVHGAPPESEGRVETRILRDPRHRRRFMVSEKEGRLSVTSYRVLRRGEAHCLVLFRPRTGRTHQIRVHAKHLGCPIVGDPVYGRRSDHPWTLMLHAARLTLVIPGERAPRSFSAPTPERFRACLAWAREHRPAGG